ncbi:flavoprotein [Actinacidiphila glaucinigra]|uniref:flavoprotein n=1 Tax=Actinacidiphila glaucinigra TaxID=235986 RepID=UPI0036C3CE35
MASDTPPSQPRPVRGVLAVVGSAADGVETLREGLVLPAIARGWRVAVTLTPTAARWLRERDEIGRLRDVTGLPVRDRSRLPGEPRPHPAADCCVLAPAGANTLAKLALGIADNQALTLLAEVLGTPHVPLVAVPAVTAAHARHPAWPRHLATLSEAGVHLVDDPEARPLPEPGEEPGGRGLPWARVLDALDRLTPTR